MTLKEVRELLKSGKTIQWRYTPPNHWADLDENEDVKFFSGKENYRLKPEPKYVPWTLEQADGKWVIFKTNGETSFKLSKTGDYLTSRDLNRPYYPEEVLELFVHRDGSPAGKLVDEQ
ncbi:MAG: hypothetical protein KGL39_55470 [Patescibacteria group bacterium]|nr:hypothetical protein [Patescibacteria group bacterium]